MIKVVGKADRKPAAASSPVESVESLRPGVKVPINRLEASYALAEPVGSEITNYTYCLREKVPKTRAQMWASRPIAEAPPRDITQWCHLSPMSSSRRLSLLYTSQERRSVVASWSSQTDDLVVGNPERMCMIRQARIATMQYIELTNRPRLHRRPQIPRRQKLSRSPLQPMRPGQAPSSLSCLRSPARTSLRSEVDTILLRETSSGEKDKATHHIPWQLVC